MLQKFLYIKRLSLRNLVCKNGRRIDMKKNKFIVCSFSAKKKGKEKKKKKEPYNVEKLGNGPFSNNEKTL